MGMSFPVFRPRHDLRDADSQILNWPVAFKDAQHGLIPENDDFVPDACQLLSRPPREP